MAQGRADHRRLSSRRASRPEMLLVKFCPMQWHLARGVEVRDFPGFHRSDAAHPERALVGFPRTASHLARPARPENFPECRRPAGSTRTKRCRGALETRSLAQAAMMAFPDSVTTKDQGAGVGA